MLKRVTPIQIAHTLNKMQASSSHPMQFDLRDYCACGTYVTESVLNVDTG